MPKIPVLRKEMTSAIILAVEAGTTGPKGGDWGHGGRTLIKFEDKGSTGWKVRIADGGGNNVEIDQPKSVELVFGGDAELSAVREAVKFVDTVLAILAESNEMEDISVHTVDMD